MPKLDKYIKAIEEEKRFEEEQRSLHDKHQNISDDTVIIEKTNTIKFLLSFFRILVKTICVILLIICAAIGILTMIYPETRAVLWTTLLGIFTETKEML